MAHNPQRVERLRMQFESQQDSVLGLKIARAIVLGKIHNSRLLLRYLRKQGSWDSQKAIAQLSTLEARIPACEQVSSLLGYEGTAAHSYFSALAPMFPADWHFSGRHRQPPPDPANAMLSLGYALLYRWMLAWILVHRMNPDIAYLHSLRNGHAALASDLIEEFRAPVVDFTVLQLVHKQKLSPSDFDIQADGGWKLKPTGLKVYLEALEQRMHTSVKHPVTLEQVSFQRCMELQVLQILAILEGRIQDYVPYSPSNW